MITFRDVKKIKKYLSADSLKDGYVYQIVGLRSGIALALYRAKEGLFYTTGIDNGEWKLLKEKHWDFDGDTKPIKEVGKCPFKFKSDEDVRRFLCKIEMEMVRKRIRKAKIIKQQKRESNSEDQEVDSISAERKSKLVLEIA